MKRFAFLLVVLAALAGGAYWVKTRYDGDVGAAWTAARAQGMALLGRAPTDGAQTGKGRGGAETASRGGQTHGAQGRGQPRIPIASAVAERTDLPITRAAVGWVEPVATVTVRSRMDGEILEQHVKDGQTVAEGDLLFRLDDREIQAQIAKDEATIAKDQASLVRAQGDAKRAQDLLARNVASQQQVDQTAADAKVAAANLAADQAALQTDKIKLGYTAIKAPIAGRVGTVRVTEGNLVKGNDLTGDGLVTITQMKPLRVAFSLPERDLALLRTALARKEPAPVRVYASGSDEPLATGTLSFVDSSVDTSSGTVTAKALFANADGRLWPGQYVRVEADLGSRPGTTTVPLVAVQPGQNGSFAFVVKPDGTVEQRTVEVADTRGDRAAIASGLEPGDRVVVEGQLRLKNGSHVVDKSQAAAAPSGRTARVD